MNFFQENTEAERIRKKKELEGEIEISEDKLANPDKRESFETETAINDYLFRLNLRTKNLDQEKKS
jgi:hypothetical protein